MTDATILMFLLFALGFFLGLIVKLDKKVDDKTKNTINSVKYVKGESSSPVSFKVGADKKPEHQPITGKVYVENDRDFAWVENPFERESHLKYQEENPSFVKVTRVMEDWVEFMYCDQFGKEPEEFFDREPEDKVIQWRISTFNSNYSLL